MKFTYSEHIIGKLTLGDIVAYQKTKDLAHLKGYAVDDIVLYLYKDKSLGQTGWKALKVLDLNSYNKKRAQSYKKIFHTKYDWIFEGLKRNKKIASPSKELINGINSCIKAKSDLPYYMEFYTDYFCVCDIDSIIDMAYTFKEEQKEMCKTLLIASCQYLRDYKDKITKEVKLHEGKTIELSDAYLDIRYQNDIWYDDDKLIGYLIDHYTDRVRRATFPMTGYLATKKEEKKLKRHYDDFNVGYEKYRFLNLAQKAQSKLQKPQNVGEISKNEKKNDLLSEKNVGTNVDSREDSPIGLSHTRISHTTSGAIIHDTTNLEVLETPITESAEEINLSIAARSSSKCTLNVKKDTIRSKDDVDYSEQQLINQKIGDRGEELVLRNELEKLKGWGLPYNKLSQIRRVSLESDDYGFDILSFDEEGNEIYIEVKTTKQKYNDFSFFLTKNEFEHAKMFGSKYSFVIVFDILKNPRIWYMGNPFIEEPYKVRIQPTQYRVDVFTSEECSLLNTIDSAK